MFLLPPSFSPVTYSCTWILGSRLFTPVIFTLMGVCLWKNSRNPIKTNVPCIPQLPPLPREVEAPGRVPQDIPTHQQSALPWARAAAVGTGGFQALRYQPWDSSAARSDLLGAAWFWHPGHGPRLCPVAPVQPLPGEQPLLRAAAAEPLPGAAGGFAGFYEEVGVGESV